MFKPRPYDPNREVVLSDAQQAAVTRNFGIFRLRGLWAQAGMLDEPFRSGVRAMIDTNLIRRGALPQLEHESAQRAKRLKANTKRDREPRLCGVCAVELLECECVPF